MSSNPSKQATSPERRPSRWWDVQEWLGFVCLVLFCYFVWPPLAFLAAAVVLVVTANLRAASGRHAKQSGLLDLDRIARAIAAYRKESGT